MSLHDGVGRKPLKRAQLLNIKVHVPSIWEECMFDKCVCVCVLTDLTRLPLFMEGGSQGIIFHFLHGSKKSGHLLYYLLYTRINKLQSESIVQYETSSFLCIEQTCKVFGYSSEDCICRFMQHTHQFRRGLFVSQV